MPIYEYACVPGNHKFEVFQKMSDPAPSSCPTCGAPEVRKLVSAAAFVLKGGGWYRDHYGLKGDSGSSKTESGSDSASSSASSAAASSSGTSATTSATSSAAPASTPSPAAPATA